MCPSSDAFAVYDDGHGFCYSCNTRQSKFQLSQQNSSETLRQEPNNNKAKASKSITTLPLPPTPTSFPAMADRAISEHTVKKYGVTVNQGEGAVKHVYPYYDPVSGDYIAAKLRSHDKGFQCRGDINKAGLFGQNLFPANSARKITIVEGECDALASYQMQGSKYPVVSVKGASSAVRDVVASYKYLDSFKEIVIVFDKDEPKINPQTGTKRYPGQEAAAAVAKLFPIGKVRVVTLKDYKDSNDYLIHGKAKDYMKEWWDAPIYKPTGLVSGKDMWDAVKEPKANDSIPYPWAALQDKTYGIRKSEMVVLNAPTGVGKTTIMKEIQHHILSVDEEASLGILHLEEPNDDTALGLMSITANKPLHLPDVREKVSTEELREYFDATLNNDRIVMWDHFGSNTIDEVVANIRYMAAMGCTHIFLDHLSILVSDQSGDERKQLDEAATKLKTLTMELGIALICVIHQNRNGEIRGTAGVEQLANIVIRMSRDLTSKDDFTRNTTVLEVQKNRFCGRTGPGGYMNYDNDTGRLRELDSHEAKLFSEGQAQEGFEVARRPDEQWS